MKTVSVFLFVSLVLAATACQSSDPVETFRQFANAAGSDDLERFKGFLADEFYGSIDRSQNDQVDNMLRLHMMAIPKQPEVTDKRQDGPRFVVGGKGSSKVGNTTGTTTLVKKSGHWKVVATKWNLDNPSQYLTPIPSQKNTQGGGDAINSCRQAARAVVIPNNSLATRQAAVSFLIAPGNNCGDSADAVVRGFEQREAVLTPEEQGLLGSLKAGRL